MTYHVQFNYQAVKEVDVEASSPEEALEIAKENSGEFVWIGFNGGILEPDDGSSYYFIEKNYDLKEDK